MQLPGKPAAVVVKVGDKIPQGATITTGAGAEVFVQPFAGTVAVVKENSTVVVEKISLTVEDGAVKKQSGLLNLKAGNLISIIDPAKRAINDYSVRTPQGVAAARGTEIGLSVNGTAVTVISTSSTVSFTTADGVSYSVSAGMVSITPPGGAPVSLASIAATNPGVATLIGQSVTAFCDALRTNLCGLSSESATTMAAQIAGIVAKAMPGQAANFTAELVAAMKACPAYSSADLANAVASVVAAAAAAAPQYAAQIAGAAAAADPALAGTIAAAVIQAVPDSKDAVIQAVATATGQSVDAVTQEELAASGQAKTAVEQTQPSVRSVTEPTPIDTSEVSTSR
jgi:hypothetical protein